MTEPRYERATQLMEADLHDEMVALDPAGGLCFGFNEVATTVWRLLDQPRSTDELHTALLEAYEVAPQQCAEELQALLDDLTARGLVRRV
jgi:hypothetical protein